MSHLPNPWKHFTLADSQYIYWRLDDSKMSAEGKAQSLDDDHPNDHQNKLKRVLNVGNLYLKTLLYQNLRTAYAGCSGSLVYPLRNDSQQPVESQTYTLDADHQKDDKNKIIGNQNIEKGYL